MINIKSVVRKAVTVSLTAALLLAAPTRAIAANIGDFLDDPEWNDFVEEKIVQNDTPGLAITMVNGSDVGCKNWSYGNIEGQTTITEDTVFCIGSCSKSFTALAIFLLQEEGKLSIDDSVSQYLPWWNVTWNGQSQDTKIWQLLEHCTGISNTTMMQYPTDSYELPSNGEIAHIAENIELVYEPGTQFEYCNLGYDILAYITETVSGMPFEEYVTNEILQPIGMTNSGYNILTTQGYRWFFRELLPYNEPVFMQTSGDGGLRSTTKDMSLWIEAQLGHIALPEKLEKAIAASNELPEEYRIDMGNGMVQYNGWIDYDGYLYHTGTTSNFSSFILIDKERDIGIFSVSNAWTFTADYAGNSLYQMVRDGKIDRSQFELADPALTLDKAASYISLAGNAMILLTLVLLFTQKKRLAKKQIKYSKEKKRLCIRCGVLLSLSVLVPLLPKIIVSIAGYGFASYRMIGVWLPYSFLAMFIVLEIWLLLMLLSSITRYFAVRNSK